MKVRLLFLFIIFSAGIITAQVKPDEYLSGSFSLGLSMKLTEARTDYSDSKLGLGLYGLAEYFIPSKYRSKLGFRIFAGGQNIYGDDQRKTPVNLRTDMYLAGAGISVAYKIFNPLFPYAYAGISNIWFDPKSEDGKLAPGNQSGLYNKSSISYDIGTGLRFFISDQIKIYGEGLVHILRTDYFDDYKSGDFNDTYISYSLGISFVLNASRDSDKDGIQNKYDPCPDLSEDFDGFEDDDGCPDLDNDKDGILDVDDECPGAAEDLDNYNDNDGCPDSDNDMDDIPDQQDQCPNQAEDFDGFNDQDGCPELDNDNDGIADSADTCTNAPEDFDGYRDDDGCPDPDNDNDGILDINDKCPDKPENINGFQDTDGCPDTLTTRQQRATEPEPKKVLPETTKTETPVNTSQRIFVIPSGNVFKSDKGKALVSDKISELDRLVKVIQNDIDSRWRIEVYIDSQGPGQEMSNITRDQAQAVLDYFVSKGLPSFQFQAHGMGSRNPVSSNNTQEDRAKNRRIVLRRYR